MNPVTSIAEEHSPAYVLGHSEQELERLSVQARLIDPITRRFFQAAGIAADMRVLDVGSGAGDTAFLTAELVGAGGEVVGIDRSSVAVRAATARAKNKSCCNVTFIEGDPTDTEFEDQFDAIVGRYVLLFQSDPTTMLRKLIKHLRPGGIVVFHEPERHFCHSFPPVISYDKCIRLFGETMKRSGANMHMGLKLYSLFLSAGLPPPTMHMEAVIAGGNNGSEEVRLLTDIVRTVLPEMERLGVATANEVEIDTLAERICAEMTANESVIVGRGEIAAWSKTEALKQ
jgi:ubiquinone/menaquinone biosynthesis C-methylase UbiE